MWDSSLDLVLEGETGEVLIADMGQFLACRLGLPSLWRIRLTFDMHELQKHLEKLQIHIQKTFQSLLSRDSTRCRSFDSNPGPFVGHRSAPPTFDHNNTVEQSTWQQCKPHSGQ